jgi:hypothetical protein
MRFLTSNIFSHHKSTGFQCQKYLKIAEMKLSSCVLEVADIRKNCGVAVAEQHFLKFAEL